VHVVHRQGPSSTPISSTAIRELVAAGDVRHAATLLGHFLRITGPVVQGFGRGRELGFPTANVAYADTQQLPGTGIYAAYAHEGDRRLPAAVSVGFNPTFGGDRVVVEAYVLDFEGDLANRAIGIDFVGRVRDERKFDRVDDLVAQMREDVVAVREILAEVEEPGELIL